MVEYKELKQKYEKGEPYGTICDNIKRIKFYFLFINDADIFLDILTKKATKLGAVSLWYASNLSTTSNRINQKELSWFGWDLEDIRNKVYVKRCGKYNNCFRVKMPKLRHYTVSLDGFEIINKTNKE